MKTFKNYIIPPNMDDLLLWKQSKIKWCGGIRKRKCEGISCDKCIYFASKEIIEEYLGLDLLLLS